ncbi:methyltransferase domain-containing protein [Candidatus Nephthysia bennettiae]|uniref:Methyltransferase domain-containing protein n=1 Tax=Candidatus Nephthysia bennettiae TaxID=3127016 RepID=A0A934N803_9BACT|nr:methyltransferase domain-containing protein [Candidatus Dormibacteraeota bacterium]MBJ7613944.1 methyltransferase domain-containing protein [Candidatus Dormibacteraeota bacterium]
MPEPEPANLRERVRQAYSRAATTPGDVHAVPVGLRLARPAGYPEHWLSSVPSTSVEVFAGVSCLPCFAGVTPGSAVLDLGCGAGLDALLVAAVAATVLGVDFSDEMLSRARRSAGIMGLGNVRFELGDAEAIPAETGSVDVALVNGIFNLNPARDEIFSELARVTRPGGHLYAAELVLKGPRSPAAESGDTDWFA